MYMILAVALIPLFFIIYFFVWLFDRNEEPSQGDKSLASVIIFIFMMYILLHFLRQFFSYLDTLSPAVSNLLFSVIFFVIFFGGIIYKAYTYTYPKKKKKKRKRVTEGIFTNSKK